MTSAFRLILWCLLAVSLPTFAQTNSCPLQPISIKNLASHISLSLQNMSGKQVTSYHVKLAFIDANGRIHSFPHTFAGHGALKSGGERTAIWHSPQAQQFLMPQAMAYILDATFSDGTGWLDDGTHACSVTSLQE